MIPASPGISIADIDTPALVVDLDTFERNMALMADYCRKYALQLRPHAKTHKAVDIARLQIRHGARGVCCQKVSEAEVFVANGIDDVLVSNQVVGERKIQRLVRLANHGTIAVCVDNLENLAALDEAASRSGVSLDVLVELDVGGGRCGVATAEQLASLAGCIDRSSHLHFRGVQAYNGHAQHIYDYEERKAAVEKSLSKLSAALNHLSAHGVTCRSVTGAGTGTYPFEAQSGIYTELQCGSYIFMDVDYNAVRLIDSPLSERFANSLFVLSTVMSVAAPGAAVCDAGLKAHSIDSGLPEILDSRGLRYIQASDEHGLIADPDDVLTLGERLLLIPGHCDPTVNLHNWLVGVRNGVVESVWPVSARGMVY